MVEIPKGSVDKQDDKGAWEYKSFGTEKRYLLIRCPKCRKDYALTEHLINTDGKISPSVVCPNVNCDFHEEVRLLDWKGVEK